MALTSKDEIRVVERFFSDEEHHPSFGLANIHAVVPDIEANKDKIARAVEVFRDNKVNVAIFPEFWLSGYFWEDARECVRYMDQAVIENHTGWIEGVLRPMLNDQLRGIVLNNIRTGPADKYLNSTYVISKKHDYLRKEDIYDKIFLPPLEKVYTESGRDDRMVIDTQVGAFGFTTCYDFMFSQLLLEYAKIDKVDAVIEVASWRAEGRREYPRMNIGTDTYYGELWDMTMAAKSATNQVWTIACNAVGIHGVTGVQFWGGSGLWAPSGLKLVQASRFQEELLIVHNVDIKGQRKFEHDDFNYRLDFEEIYRPVKGKRTFTRVDI
jgi:predicted amidohydrolase